MKNNFLENQKGALLMQVLVSFGILVFLSLVSIPYIKEYQPSIKLSATARDMTADLRYAQQLTVTEQVEHIVDFDLATDNYRILRKPEDSATTTVKTVNFDEDVSYQQITGLTEDNVVFNFYGGVSESGQVVLINSKGRTATINIKPSGYIQLGE